MKRHYFIFVLMPFDSKFDDIYHLGIKQACKDSGDQIYCERVDEQIYEGSMVARIYNQIEKADLIIADMTGKNANVFYEVGFATGIGKRIIFLTQDVKDIPFDLKDYAHIVYEGSITKLKDELGKRVKWFLDNPLKKGIINTNALKYFIKGIEIKDNPCIQVSNDLGLFEIKIDINNTTKIPFNNTLKLSLITPGYLRKNRVSKNKEFYIGDDQKLFSLGEIPQLFPSEWYSVKITFEATKKIKEKSIPLILRSFSAMGYIDYPFIVEIEKEDGGVAIYI